MIWLHTINIKFFVWHWLWSFVWNYRKSKELNTNISFIDSMCYVLYRTAQCKVVQKMAAPVLVYLQKVWFCCMSEFFVSLCSYATAELHWMVWNDICCGIYKKMLKHRNIQAGNLWTCCTSFTEYLKSWDSSHLTLLDA